MRTKDVLFKIEDIGLLLQYLYINKEHRITFNNGITNLQLRMEDDLSIKCKNMSFPDAPEFNYSSEMTPANCFSLIETLEKCPSVEYPSAFNNRWDEIKAITLSNMALNRPKKY